MYACLEVRLLLAEGRRFPPGSPVSSANKTDRRRYDLRCRKWQLNTNQSSLHRLTPYQLTVSIFSPTCIVYYLQCLILISNIQFQQNKDVSTIVSYNSLPDLFHQILKTDRSRYI